LVRLESRLDYPRLLSAPAPLRSHLICGIIDLKVRFVALLEGIHEVRRLFILLQSTPVKDFYRSSVLVVFLKAEHGPKLPRRALQRLQRDTRAGVRMQTGTRVILEERPFELLVQLTD